MEPESDRRPTKDGIAPRTTLLILIAFIAAVTTGLLGHFGFGFNTAGSVLTGAGGFVTAYGFFDRIVH
jgi:hypothetical protein